VGSKFSSHIASYLDQLLNGLDLARQGVSRLLVWNSHHHGPRSLCGQIEQEDQSVDLPDCGCAPYIIC
jgi:hypothetical protein